VAATEVKPAAHYRPSEAEQETLDEFRRKLEAAMPAHGEFVRKVERGYRSYHGILKSSSPAASWKHKMHPPVAFNLIETIVSSTIEQGLRMKVTPAPSLSYLPVPELQKMADTAETVEHLIRHEWRVDNMDGKQRALMLEMAIAGRAFGKSYWNLTEGTTKKQGIVHVQHVDDDGTPLGTTPTVTEISETKLLRDHSTFEVRDSRDVILHESARELQPWMPGGCQHLFDRGWYSKEQLLDLQASGYLKNVEALGETRDYSDAYTDRERVLHDLQRTKDLHEVIEFWSYKHGSVWRSIIGNRAVVLRAEEESPFWHGGYPFICCRSQPESFSMHGKGEIELIEQLQEMLWELMNQRLDNVELVNNMILLVSPEVEDPEGLRWFPGAQWQASPQEVAPLQVPYQVAEVALSAEQALRGDLQNVTAAAPFTSGTETQTVDQKTATGASIVMSAAQNRLAAKKYQAQLCFPEEASMRLKNCQQFMSSERSIHILGPDGNPYFKRISVLDLEGEFLFELTPYGESTLRQERRAETTQKTQVLLQSLPLGAAVGTPLSYQVVMTEFLKEWGDENPQKYFSQQPAAMGAAAGPGGPGGSPTGQPGLPPGQPQGQLPPGQGNPNLGTTASSAVDATSPSASGGMSMSPALMVQRAQALSSGPTNA
jgi:hypothetical protein